MNDITSDEKYIVSWDDQKWLYFLYKDWQRNKKRSKRIAQRRRKKLREATQPQRRHYDARAQN
jgi:hypothetical protein